MKKIIAALVVLTVLLTMGCGQAQSSAGSDRETAGKLGVKASTSEESGAEAAPEQGRTGPEQAAPAGQSGQAAAEETAAAEAAAEESASVKAAAEESASVKAAAEESASAKAAAGETSAAGESAQAGTEADRSAEKEEAAQADSAPEEKQEQKEETPEARPEAEEEEEEYIPEGFVPYGNYLLVYDSGYEVKSRYSEAGLTFYMESEEFLFILDKNLPNFPGKVAHMLFNTAAPMDPSEAGEETFPYDEGYVMYINLDDGSYYEVYKSQLDLKGRIFVRDLYESFRQKWEGAF